MKRLCALILTLLAVISLTACGSTESNPDSENASLSAIIDTSDTGFIVCDSGNILEIPDTKEAYVTSDRKYLLQLSTKGTLGLFSFAEEKTTLENADVTIDRVSQFTFNENGFSCIMEEGTICRCLFDDKSIFNINYVVDATLTTSNMDMYFASKGTIYSVPHNSKTAERIGTYSNDIYIYGASKDGSKVIMEDYNADDSTTTVYYYDGIETVKLDVFKSNDYSTGINYYYSDLGDYVVVSSYNDTKLLVKGPNSDFKKIEFNGEIGFYVRTSQGLFYNSASPDGFYVDVGPAEDHLYDVYWVTFDGEKEKLFSDVRNYDVANGLMYYINKDQDLYRTKAVGESTDTGERIASDVYTIDLSYDDEYVYYIKNVIAHSESSFNGTGTLYGLGPKSKEPVRIASDVYLTYYNFAYISVYSELFIADHGKSVLFFKNPEDHNYHTFSTLYLYRWGSDEPVKIKGEVHDYLYRANKTYLSSDSFLFSRYIDDESSDAYIYDWYYYNGNEATLIAKNAKY